MFSTWSGHLSILPPSIRSRFIGNRIPISIGEPTWAPLPGPGDGGADLTQVWCPVSPATGAGSGGHGAQEQNTSDQAQNFRVIS